MENFYQIAFVLLSSVGGGGILIFALSSWLGKVWASRILESDKAKYSKELDSMRHQFKIELNQLSIIHENQKNSFQRVIKTLQKSIKSLEQEYDEEWMPISGKYYDELKQVIIEESLFLGIDGEKVLVIYLKFFGQVIYFPEDQRPENKDLRGIYQYLVFMSELIREYFRKRIGLSESSHPLLDIYLIAACRLLNEYPLEKEDSQSKTIFEFTFDTPPQELVEKIRVNISSFKSELEKHILFLEEGTKKEKCYYFPKLAAARGYLSAIEKA